MVDTLPATHHTPAAVAPASEPAKAVLPSTSDAQHIARAFATSFESAASSPENLVRLIHPDGYWRDLLALQWDFRTVEGADKVKTFLSENNRLANARLSNIQIENGRDSVSVSEPFPNVVWIQAFFTFETAIGRGRGCFRLQPSPGDTSTWKAFTTYTALEEIKGHEEPLAPENRPNGVQHGAVKGRKTWLQRRAEEVEFRDKQPTVVIIGAGQAGLSIAARLKMLDVPTLIVEKQERVGDSWRKRFRQLVLHDNTQYNHMPLMPFPDFWPRFTPKDRLANFFESYADALELNVWTSTTLDTSAYDDSSKKWTLEVTRGNGEKRTLNPTFCIMCSGHSGVPKRPTFKGEENFKGDIMHSSKFIDGDQYKGKKAIVVGACNSGHDIAQDFWESGAESVTIVQRTSTYILSIDSVVNVLFGSIYNEDKKDKPCPSTEDCDLIFNSTPNFLHKKLHVGLTAAIAENDKELLESLRKAGFNLDFGPDDSGFLMKYFSRGGGYYLDVGCSGLIALGEVKLKSGQAISHFTEKGLVFADGSEVEADVVVLATGYDNMRTKVREIFGEWLYNQTNDVWGLDDEGELRTMWQDSGHPGFYFHGGNLALCRYMSKRLALRIKAQTLGLL